MATWKIIDGQMYPIQGMSAELTLTGRRRSTPDDIKFLGPQEPVRGRNLHAAAYDYVAFEKEIRRRMAADMAIPASYFGRRP